MQHLPQGVKDREGCYVYQYVGDHKIGVRAAQNVGDECRTGQVFNNGDLISIDLVSPSRVPESPNGPFLRLSDRSGWLFESKYNEKAMQKIDVSSGLWCFVVDNCPYGIALRKHPIDNQDVIYENVSYEPMQRIYCDRKVQHPSTGINFYRVQGTEGWVFDRRLSKGEDCDDEYMLLEEDMIKTGCFVYEIDFWKDVNMHISIRTTPHADDSNKTDQVVSKGQLIAADTIRKSPYSYGNGPFVRLTDGSGWLFENKNNQQLMRPLRLQEGKWRCKILNSPAGIALRRQPIDSQSMIDKNIAYKPGEIVQCSHMVQASSGVKFYRVEGSNGWIFDKRNGEAMLTVLSGQSQFTNNVDSIDFSDGGGSSSGWCPNFVRGIAAAVEGVIELSINEQSRVISFGTVTGDVRINVYYTTQTIGTALSHPNQGGTQLFRRNCTTDELVKILENPRIHTGKGYKRRRGNNFQYQSSSDYAVEQFVSTPYGDGLMADQEIEMRNALLELDEEMKSINRKKQRLLTRIRNADLDRAKEAKKMKADIDERAAEFRERQRVIIEKEAARQRAVIEKEAADRDARTCQVCGKEFNDRNAMLQHYHACHAFQCNYCYKEFNSVYSLNQHKNALGHW